MKRLLFIFLILMSCSDYNEVTRTVCTCEQRKQVAEYVKSSIKDANNMSDEEMEDVIDALYRTALATFCELKTVKIVSGTTYVLYEPLESCEYLMP